MKVAHTHLNINRTPVINTHLSHTSSNPGDDDENHCLINTSRTKQGTKVTPGNKGHQGGIGWSKTTTRKRQEKMANLQRKRIATSLPVFGFCLLCCLSLLSIDDLTCRWRRSWRETDRRYNVWFDWGWVVLVWWFGFVMLFWRSKLTIGERMIFFLVCFVSFFGKLSIVRKTSSWNQCYSTSDSRTLLSMVCASVMLTTM